MSLILFGVISIILLKRIAEGSKDNVTDYDYDYITIGDAETYVCNASSGGNVVTQIYHVAVNRSGFEDKCNFENNDLCSWRQDSNDIFDWTLGSGTTSSDGTGPPGDHTTHGATGKYIYIEASGPRKQGDNAAIVSHPLPANQPTCLSFFYNMFGLSIGTLDVTIVDKCSGQTQRVFHESGNKGEAWKEATVSIPASAVPNEYEIKIGATVGSSYSGDIALDDILIQDTSCADPSISIIGNQMVNENSSLTLSCQLSTCSTSACTYSWTSSQAIPGNRPQQTMTLTNIKRDLNAATLYCRVNVNVSLSIVGSTTMNVQYGPSSATISVSSPLTLTENTLPPTAITCSSPVCNPSCNAKWINGSTQMSSTMLFSTPASRYFAGSYICTVSNTVGIWNKRLEIIVNYAPDVTLTWDESSKTLTCKAAGNPTNYTFHALEFRILGFPIRNISFQSGTGGSRYAVLKELSYQDKGSYTCTVENGILKNGATRQSHTLEVVIKDVPVLLEHTRTYTVSKGDPLTVTIPIYAIPIVPRTGIAIQIGDRIMSFSDSITVNLEDGIGVLSFHNKSIASDIQKLLVVINATKEEYFRNFTVNFTNAVGTTIAFFEIVPQGPPDIPVRFKHQSTTYNSVSFAVNSGFFNGGDQTLVIEYRRVNSNSLWENGSEAFVGNGSNVFVAMMVGDLKERTDYEFRVYAFNVYGQSQYSAVVPVATDLHILMVVGIVTGCTASIGLIVLVVCLKKKRDKKKQPFVPIANIPPTSAGQKSQGQAENHVYAEGSTATKNIFLTTYTTEFAPLKVYDDESYANSVGNSADRQTSMASNRCNTVKDPSHDEEDYMNLRLGTPQSMVCDMSGDNRTHGTTLLPQKSINTDLEQGSINLTIAQTSTKTPFAARNGKRAIIQEKEGDYIQMNAPRKPAKHMYENTQLTPVKTKSKEMKGDEFEHDDVTLQKLN